MSRLDHDEGNSTDHDRAQCNRNGGEGEDGKEGGELHGWRGWSLFGKVVVKVVR